MPLLSGHPPLVLATLIAIFVIANMETALKNPLKINKPDSALLGASLLWTIYAFRVIALRAARHPLF